MKVLVLDTETTNEKNDQNAKRVYDIGYSISDPKTGAVYVERRFLVREIWENAALMASAYYAEKIPAYRDELDRGEVRALPLQAIRLQLTLDMVEHGISDVYAFNADFDHKALDSTIAYLSNGFITEFLPSSVTYKCIWGYAQDTICRTSDYLAWCVQNAYLSPSGIPRTNAEIVYRYITRNTEFTEAHTALEDVKIEREILAYSKKHHGRKKGAWTSGSRWRELKALMKQD